MEIMKYKMSDYFLVDIILKIVLVGLIIMWILGMAQLFYHLITNPAAIDNATFGIFDTI
jgi:predicted transglutaminase-like protease